MFWVALAGAVLYSTDFLKEIFTNPLVNKLYFNVSLAILAINSIIGLYLCIFLPYIARVDIPWDKYCPRVIPTATVLGLVCMGTSTKALWPVWGLLTPFVLVSLGMGALFSLHFIPFL